MFEKNSNLSTYPWLCDLSSKCYTAWKGAFDVCRSQDIAGDCPGKRVPQCFQIVHGPILILVPIRGTKDDCCELIAHKVEIENLYDNLSVGVAFKIFFSCKSAGNDL